MKVSFVTSSDNKIKELGRVLGDRFTVNKLVADLPELQSLDPIEVIRPKLLEAIKLFPNQDAIIVEDTSFCVDALHGLPGTFIKHFLEAPKRAQGADSVDPKAGPNLIYYMARGAQPEGELVAKAVVHIGYINQNKQQYFFTGHVDGHLVPAGERGWGFDKILVPIGYQERLGDLGPEVKSQISHRAMAAMELKKYLLTQTD